MLAQKQPPFKECVIAHWSRGSAPKISGAQVQNRSRGMRSAIYRVTERADAKDSVSDARKRSES